MEKDDFRKFDDAVDVVSDELMEMKHETDLRESFESFEHIGSAIERSKDEIKEKLSKEPTDEDVEKIEEMILSWIGDSEPSAVIMWRGEERDYITPYQRPAHFDVEWHSIDAWRGSYSVVSSEEYKKIMSDTILHGHYTEKKLKQLQEHMREKFAEYDIDFAEIYPRTSNVFATGFDIYVPKDKYKTAKRAIIETKEDLNISLDKHEERLKKKLDEVI